MSTFTYLKPLTSRSAMDARLQAEQGLGRAKEGCEAIVGRVGLELTSLSHKLFYVIKQRLIGFYSFYISYK